MRADGVVDGLEQIACAADGSTFPAATTSRMIEYEGEPAFVTSVVDLTERRAAEAEMQRQRETLHQSEKLAALGALLAGVAHELNNPLSVVVGYAEHARGAGPGRRHPNARAAGCTRRPSAARGSSRRSSPWRAQRPPQRGPVALDEVVESALELAGYGLRTAGIEIVRELAPACRRSGATATSCTRC